MRYDVTCLCSGFGTDDVLQIGLDATGDAGEITLKKAGGFDDWLADVKMLSDGRTVGQANRETLHRLLDAWLDGVEFEA